MGPKSRAEAASGDRRIRLSSIGVLRKIAAVQGLEILRAGLEDAADRRDGIVAADGADLGGFGAETGIAFPKDAKSRTRQMSRQGGAAPCTRDLDSRSGS